MRIKKKRAPVVEFIDISGGTHESLRPRPAKLELPDWYKNMEGYVPNLSRNSGPGSNPSTIKRCMPVFDAITVGYIIFTPMDVQIVNGREVGDPSSGKKYGWPNKNVMAIEFHGHEQAESHPYTQNQKVETGSIPKWNHPWAIRTPKGYSCLFVAPLHRDSPIQIMEGVVDTDVYNSPVKFPFVFNDPNFSGVVSAGTPLAQVIPFRRESYRHSISTANSSEVNPDTMTSNTIGSFFLNAYKNVMWSKKDYS